MTRWVPMTRKARESDMTRTTGLYARFLLGAILLAASFPPSLAWAQGVPGSGIVVGTCGTPPNTYSAGQTKPITIDTAGRNCDNAQAVISGPLPAGTNIIGKVGIDQTTDVTTNGVEIAPTAGAAAGITPVVSASAEGTHVLKASPGNLYGITITSAATPGLLMVFDATSAPGDGAVTPKLCRAVPANSSVGVSWIPGPPAIFATGISVVFSTGTNCFNKTASATAMFEGYVK